MRRGEVVGGVTPEDGERFWGNREAALDPANPKPYVHHEFRVRRQDGTVRWVEGHGLAYFEGAGPKRRVVSFGGTAQDITERKEREEKENLLMREINHRAKNMLSVVDAIAHQTATRNPEDFVERFSERIQALSANQDLLVRNDGYWSWRCPLGDQWRHLPHEVDRARWPARFHAEAARVRHHSYGSDDGAQRGWHGRP